MDQVATDTPPAPPAQQPQIIVAAQDVLIMTPEMAAVFAKYDRRLPLDLRYTLAMLAVNSTGRRYVDPMTEALEQHADEMAHHGGVE